MQPPSTGREQERPLWAFLPNTGGYGEGAPRQGGQGREGRKPAREGEAGRATHRHTEGHVRPSYPHSDVWTCRAAPRPGHSAAGGNPCLLRGRGGHGRGGRRAAHPAEPPRPTPSTPSASRWRQGSAGLCRHRRGCLQPHVPRKLGNRRLECLRKLGCSSRLQWAELKGNRSVTRVARESAGKGRKG